MIFKRQMQTLTGRIILAMTVMTAIVGAVYCFAVYTSVMITEATLIGGSLESDLRAHMTQTSPSRDASTIIYTDSPLNPQKYQPIPENYRQMPDGFSEVIGTHDRFIYKLRDNNSTWVIEQDQFGFEDLEIEIYIQAVAGLLLATGLSALLGLMLARSVTVPVKRLAQDVRDMARNHTEHFAHPIAGGDEIAELAKTLEKTLVELHQALNREKAFTADVGHELRTPLMVISSSLELMSVDKPELAQSRQFQNIADASERMNRLVRVFLELARGKVQSDMPQASMVKTILEVIEIRRLEAQKQGVELYLVDRTSQMKLVNAILFYCLVDNLVHNAIAYTTDGAVTVTAEDACISVSDTGKGISKTKPEAFAPFVRGKNAPGEGYGWGLSLVQRICTHCGWALSVKDNAPHGTVFTITGL